MDSRQEAANRQNRGNQCNPNHVPTGPGHKAGYQGDRSQANLDNRANQKNSNNDLYRKK